MRDFILFQSSLNTLVMFKNKEAGNMRLTVESSKKTIYGRNYRTDSPSFMHEGPRIVQEVFLDLDIKEPWQKTEFVLKNMETGEKIIKGGIKPNPFDSSLPLTVRHKLIGTNYSTKNNPSIRLLPTNVKLQGRMKLIDGLFFREELPEDKASFVLNDCQYVGEIPKAKVELRVGKSDFVISDLYWNVEICAPKESKLIQATLDIYVVKNDSGEMPLYPECGRLVYSEEFQQLPEVGGETRYFSNLSKKQTHLFEGEKAKAFLTIRNSGKNICVYSDEITIS